jgi:hypothetical protein
LISIYENDTSEWIHTSVYHTQTNTTIQFYDLLIHCLNYDESIIVNDTHVFQLCSTLLIYSPILIDVDILMKLFHHCINILKTTYYNDKSSIYKLFVQCVSTNQLFHLLLPIIEQMIDFVFQQKIRM